MVTPMLGVNISQNSPQYSHLRMRSRSISESRSGNSSSAGLVLAISFPLSLLFFSFSYNAVCAASACPDSQGGRVLPWRCHAGRWTRPPVPWRSVPARVELRLAVRPVDVGFQRLHCVPVRIDLLAFVRLLDAPADHVAQGGEGRHLFLVLGKLVRVRVRGEWVAHGTGHPGVGQFHAEPLLRVRVAMKQVVAVLHLFQEGCLECLQLLGAEFLLVREHLLRVGSDEKQRSHCRGDGGIAKLVAGHGGSSSVFELCFAAARYGPPCADSISDCGCRPCRNRRPPRRTPPCATSGTRCRHVPRRSCPDCSSPPRRNGRRDPPVSSVW